MKDQSEAAEKGGSASELEDAPSGQDRLAWRHLYSLRGGFYVAALVAFAIILTVGNLSTLRGLQADAAWVNKSGRIRMQAYRILHLASRHADASDETAAAGLADLRSQLTEVDRAWVTLSVGDEGLGIPRLEEASILADFSTVRDRWKETVKPAILRSLDPGVQADTRRAARNALDELIPSFVRQVNELVGKYEKLAERHGQRAEIAQLVFALFSLIALVLVLIEGRKLVGRERDSLRASRQELQIRKLLEATEQERARSDSILNSTADGTITITDEGIITSFNRSASKLFGYAPEEVLGRNIRMLMPSPYQEEHDGYLESYMRTGVAKVLGREREAEGRRKDGSSFPLALRVGEMPTEGQSTFIGTVQDITERKRREEERTEIFRTLQETVARLSSASTQILAGTHEQTSGAQEQASAVAETMTTVNEVAQVAQEASDRAKSVAESAKRCDEVGRVGRAAVAETVTVMGAARDGTEAIAEKILELADQAQAIGEIISTVSDIAEQTNLLALNAAIEASRAGEQGKGFSVVASEVKALADQSRRATAQVREILGEIQKATNSAVMATEEGSKSVKRAMSVAGEAGETISTLADAIADAATSASQIMASANQQSIGMSQIQEAIKNIDMVSKQGMRAVQQTKNSVEDLNSLGNELKDVVEYGV